MDDKRITKSKKAIKSALIEILQEMPFEKITVTEICRRGIVSRITFYTHYEDKYSLVEEMCSDYIVEADDNYHRLQKINNPQNRGVQGYVNLLEAILEMFYANYAFFSRATVQVNPYLYSMFFNKVYISVDDYLERHRGVVPQLPRRQTAAFLCNSMFGVINTCIMDNMPEDQVKKTAHDIYRRLLASELFYTPEEETGSGNK